MPLFRTRLRVLRAEREWSQAKLAVLKSFQTSLAQRHR
jgi:hypothetical protein